ncbi:MAG: polysaccharide deacetylase family protein [Vicingaceae bacterium]|nr:polysaccharide deacetylase family protein [Vicingaceae bacterium]
MILVYSHNLTPRLKYIFKTIFTDILLVKIEFTSDIQVFEKYESVKINYSDSELNSGIFFQASKLLFEDTIQQQEIIVKEFEGSPSFFEVDNQSAFPFDPFAASFYLISRYEEYLPHKKDKHGRFCIKEALAYQYNFLETPLVNIWINKIVNLIEKEHPNFKFPQRNFEFLSTLDIDNAFAYKHKGFTRTVGALTKSLFKGKHFSDRLKVIFGNQKDPYNTYNYQKFIHKKYNISPLYFFLLGDYGKHDKNISHQNKSFQNLIKSIAVKNNVGIHPSYKSNANARLLIKEKNRLTQITRGNIKKSRQHYLMLKFPDTYKALIKSGIKEDYTMGFAEKPGFRASICSPFYFYNLNEECETELKIFPFAVMEATFKYYKKTSPERTIQEILSIMQIVKTVNGSFVSVWHNESLSNEGIWKGWKIVYEKMLKEAQNKD